MHQGFFTKNRREYFALVQTVQKNTIPLLLVFVAPSVAWKIEQSSPEVPCLVAEFGHPSVGFGSPSVEALPIAIMREQSNFITTV